MKKTDLDKIANDFFAKHKVIESIIVSSDGLVFIAENAANLHKNTNSKKLKITLNTYKAPTVASKDEGEEDGVVFPMDEKTIKSLKLPDLQKMAEDLKIDLKDLDTKAKIADAINTLKAKS